MRVLVVGRSRRRDIEASLYRTLRRTGHRAAITDERRLAGAIGRAAAGAWVLARARLFRPERIILSKPVGLPASAVASLAELAPSVMWYRDLRIPPLPEIIERARHVETLFLTAGGQAGEYEAAGVPRARFLPDGVDPELDRPGEPVREFACDIAFIGSGDDAYRAEFLARLARRWRVRTFGRRWARNGAAVGWIGRPVYDEEFGRVCASARIVLGLDRAFHTDARVRGYTSNRLWRTLAAGGFYLGPASPGLRELVRDGEHCALYDDEADALERIERYLADAAARERIRAAGRAFVLAHHTFEHRLDNLLTGRAFRNPLDDPDPAASR